MTRASNNQGRAFEFACLNILCEAVSEKRPAKILENSSYTAAQNAWDTLGGEEQDLFTLSAKSTIDTIFALEPNMVEGGDDMLTLYIQTDNRGEEADPRDIIVERKDIVWEIGLSIKHNHMAVKHSRLAKSLDFGKKWYGVPCSQEYWDEVKPVFDFLETEKEKGALFRDLKSKEDQVYVPLLNAFTKEVTKQVMANKEIPKMMVKYLLSKYDFYKVISIDSKRVTSIQCFNIYGTLNRPSKTEEPKIKKPMLHLPSTLLFMGFKPGSKTTVVMCFDRGWQFSFRIHNAKHTVEPSLKFDIRIEGMAADVDLTYYCKW